ncbi:LysR family transcriptional regulator [Nocardioides sp. C4-1]|uniref:LysR family transcriptional regulator n=1 Tax=Nocardioides sp. C4-1 TaxID=3151851 RepID=UPI003264FCA1
MEIDPRRLRFLLAVARFGGVLAAADELRVTPSAVSQQLSRLEHETGRILLDRTPRGTSLTSAGLALAEAAEEVERALSEARTRIAEQGDDVTGRVVLGGFSSFFRAILLPHLQQWRRDHPGLEVGVVEDELPVLMRQLRRGELDLVVAELDAGEGGTSLPAGMVEEPLLDEPWKLLVPQGTLVGPEGFDPRRTGLPWLGVDPDSAGAAALARLQRAEVAESQTVHQYYEIVTAVALVAAGEGITVVPALALPGLVTDDVDVLDVPGLGTRRIVLRRVVRRRQDTSASDTVVRLLRDAIVDLGYDTQG